MLWSFKLSVLVLHNIFRILKTFGKCRQRFFLVLFDVNQFFNCFKYWCNWLSTVLIIVNYLFYWFKYTNWLVFGICLPIFSCLWFFLILPLIFLKSVHIPYTYFCCTSFFHKPIIKLLSQYHFFDWNFQWYWIWCL